MTRTAIRYALSALVALALVPALASSPPASAQMESQINNMMNNNLMFNRGKPKGARHEGLVATNPTAQGAYHGHEEARHGLHGLLRKL